MASPPDVITVELVDGTKVVVPDSLELITSYVLQEQGDWFEDEIKFLRELVQPGDTVVDIGANYGVYALSLARKVGASGQVWAFEPASETASLLQESASANNTTWLQVVQQALSDREGTAWLQMPGQAELNSLADPTTLETATQQGPGESVAITTLDHCLERHGWTGVDLLKIDAEGEEERILKGGKRFFQDLSPLVMFEVKAGAELHLDLVLRFQELAYQCFRLIPGMNALVPFGVDQQADGYLLNLFAAKPDRIATLAAAGWLANEDHSFANDSEDSIFIKRWLETLKQKPYARGLEAYWELNAQHPEQATLSRALAAWGFAQDYDQPTPSRSGALTQSLELLEQVCKPGCNPSRWANLARVALACGQRVQAVEALNVLVGELQSGRRLDLREPFLSPDPAFEEFIPIESIESWLEASALSAIEQRSCFSGFYTGRDAIPRLERIVGYGYAQDLAQQRLQLVQRRYGIQSQEERSSSQSVRAWFDFLDLEKPLVCLDVGALSLQGETEPWVHWAHEGCAEVLGFEPLANECDQLNLKAKASGASIRYLPWALGDGKKHTLHITNEPMTSSLFPPARSTVDLFPGLGELMQVANRTEAQTRRLDDIPEARGADFLKLNVQGAELMILTNAIEVLRSVSVIQCEVEFLELYEGQPLLADIDSFLRSQGFCFHRFEHTMGRPFKPLRMHNNPLCNISQDLWGDAIYIRDFRNLEKWSDRHLQAAIFVLHEKYCSVDIALLLLRELDKRHLSDLSNAYIMSLLASQTNIGIDLD